jgi:hypothetical protein
LYQSMELMHSFCKHSTNNISASLKGERSFSMIRDLRDPSRMISPKSFALCFKNVFYFIQETLCTLQACECYVLAYIAWHFALKKFNLRWVPHTLDNNQKSKWVVLSSELLKVITSERRNKFDHIIIVDESWFYLEYPHTAI